MSRGPRKPGDPARWPIPCGRCGGHYPKATTWPDGTICGYCYQGAKRTTGVCSCGHVGVLPGLVDGQPVCRSCSGVRLNVDCVQCGAEGELYANSCCWRCTLGSTIDRVLAHPDSGQIQPSLLRLAGALRTMPRANSGLTWIRQPHVTRFLTQLAATGVTSHDDLDRLMPSPTREYVRGLLVEHQVLPHRDEHLPRFLTWANTAIKRVPDGPDHDALARYIRWQLVRRMRGADVISQSMFQRSKQNVTVAADFINWLHSHRGKALTDVSQTDLDVWQATGPSTREFAVRFLTWATKTRIIQPGLEIHAYRRGTAERLSSNQQNHVIDHAVNRDDLSARDQLLVILILIFGQPVERVAALTWDHVTVGDDVTIRLGGLDIVLPAPLDHPLRDLARNPVHANTAAHPNSAWVFRGRSPGRHSSPAALRLHLRDILAARAARLGTLHELTKTTPVAILAEVLGYSPATIDRHAKASASTYARYLAAVKETDTPS